MTEEARIENAMDRSWGLREDKYLVRRLGGTPHKHDDCEFFVLDWQHDAYTIPALLAYADACQAKFPALASSLRAKCAAQQLAEAAPSLDRTVADIWHLLDDLSSMEPELACELEPILRKHLGPGVAYLASVGRRHASQEDMMDPKDVLEAYRHDAEAIRSQVAPRSWSSIAILRLWDALAAQQVAEADRGERPSSVDEVRQDIAVTVDELYPESGEPTLMTVPKSRLLKWFAALGPAA